MSSRATKGTNTASTTGATKRSAKSLPTEDWLQPISSTEPCGANLEYDSEYSVLMARLAPKGEAQYGDFIATREVPDWADVERNCRRLMLRTRDINVLLLLLRCRINQAQATGLREGLDMLLRSLQHYPDDIHPQATLEGKADPLLRANALAMLTDPDGVMADVRAIVLAKNSVLRLQVRDVERAFAQPRPSDAMAPESVRRQLTDLRGRNDPGLAALTRAAQLAQDLHAWCRQHLGDDSPDLGPFVRQLAWFAEAPVEPTLRETEIEVAPEASDHEPTDEASPGHAPEPEDEGTAIPQNDTRLMSGEAVATPTHTGATQSLRPVPSNPIASRQAMARQLRQCRQWFELHEPSSPVAVLLKQAERMVGQRYAELAQAIPIDLLQRWDSEPEADTAD